MLGKPGQILPYTDFGQCGYEKMLEMMTKANKYCGICKMDT
jgi:hypothetical protein